MEDHTPTPRPNLFTNRDEAAWREQFHLLRDVLSMSVLQIAQIDHGLDPGHPEAGAAALWATHIERLYPPFDVQAYLKRLR